MVEPSTLAHKLGALIDRAPAGGVFHDAETSSVKTLHDGFANEQAYFFVDFPTGERVVVTVEKVK